MTAATSAVTAGLGSGLDTASLVDGLVAAEAQPMTALQSTQSSINAASSTISSFSSKLSALQSAARALADSTGFSSVTASSSDSSIVATARGTSTTGSYNVSVTQIACEQRTYSSTQASSTDPLGQSGTLSIGVGTNASVDVAIGSADSLTDVAAKISSSGARVSASVMYDGSNYRLVVRGLDTGAANAVTFNESGASLGLGLNLAANTFQKAQDTQLTVDNIAITRPTTQVTGVIPGVTLTVTKPTTAAATITLASDSSSLKTKITTLVNAYNDMVNLGHNTAGHGSTKATNSVLAGDHAIRTSLDRFARILSSPVAGTSGHYTTLSSVGISSTQDGLLKFDSTKLDAAIQADPTSVQRLFVTDASIGATGAMSAIASAVDSLTAPGSSPIAAELDGFAARNKVITKQLEGMQTRLDNYRAALNKQFLALDQQVNAYRAQSASLTSSTG